MLQWLESNFPEVPPMAFYRDLFPLGSLDKRDAFTKGKYTAIAIQIKDGRPLKYVLTDELDNLEELLNSDFFTMISPISYCGKSMKAENQREIFALAIDLDNTIIKDGKPVGLESLFSQIERAKMLPRPTYVVATSEKCVHLYYVFEEPVKAFYPNKETLANYKTYLTAKMWNRYVTSDYDRVQQEPIGQNLRAVGSVQKRDKNKIVRAFLTGDKVSIDYLNSFAPDSAKIDVSYTPKEREKVEQAPRKTWTAKPDLYEWWLREMLKGAAEGRRYFCCLCAGIYAQKSGISRTKLEKDILDMVPYLDSLTTDEHNHFTYDDALKAISSYDTPHYIFMRRATIERLSGIPIPANKRNGMKRNVHLKLMRDRKKSLIEVGQLSAIGGRPSKSELVIAEYLLNPSLSISAIARNAGVDIKTARRWVRAYQENPEKFL